MTSCRPPGYDRIVGPDGNAMLHVHCGREQGECFRMAGEQCPYGYEIQPVYSANEGNFLVRCRPAVAIVTNTAPGTTLATQYPGAPRRSTQQGWPPASGPWQPA